MSRRFVIALAESLPCSIVINKNAILLIWPIWTDGGNVVLVKLPSALVIGVVLFRIRKD